MNKNAAAESIVAEIRSAATFRINKAERSVFRLSLVRSFVRKTYPFRGATPLSQTVTEKEVLYTEFARTPPDWMKRIRRAINEGKPKSLDAALAIAEPLYRVRFRFMRERIKEVNKKLS